MTIFVNSAVAQDSYSYFAPHGKRVFHSAAKTDWNGNVIFMNGVDELSSNTDGLVVEFDVENLVEGDKLLTFDDIDGYFDNHAGDGAFLEIYYSGKTMKLRRYHSSGVTYDYLLFDPLFQGTGLSPVYPAWNIRFFFTAHFMWIEVAQVNKYSSPPTRQFISLTYFGLDYDLSSGSTTHMSYYLQRRERAKILLGDDTRARGVNSRGNRNGLGFRIPGRIQIYEFNYADFIDRVQREFSNPSGLGLNRREVASSPPEEDNQVNTRISTSTNSTENIAELQENTVNGFSIYPNPAKNTFHVLFNLQDTSLVKIEIVNLLGKVLYSQEKMMVKGNHTIDLDRSMVKGSGIYLLKLKSNFFIKSKNIVFNN